MLACDFFHVDRVITWRRVYVFFVLEADTRHIHLRGRDRAPGRHADGAAGEEPADGSGERAAGFRFLVRDRAGQFTEAFDAVLATAGIEAVKIPSRSPRANAHADRWVRTVRSKVTDRMLITGPRHLRDILDKHVAHDNHHRPHRARNLRPPDSHHVTTAVISDTRTAKIRRQRVLGGLINEYQRAA